MGNISKIAFVRTVVAAGGLLFVCAAPEMALGQSIEPGAAPPAPLKSPSAARVKSAGPHDWLEGKNEKRKIK